MTTTAPRAAVLSVHTSPVDQPGTGDSGGMNVYIKSVATRLQDKGIDVDLFTRCRGGVDHETKHLTSHAHVVAIKAGPCAPIPKADVPRYLPEFLGGVIRHAKMNGHRYDVVHSHYWLSGWVGNAIKELWDVPLVSSFHTLGKVKNYSLAPGEAPESAVRIAGESRVISASDRILAATPAEAGQLVGLYRAEPEHIRLVPPGVDHTMFTPRDRTDAQARLYLKGLRLALFVGRLQSHKGPDIAIRTIAEAVALDPTQAADLQLAIVGGPSGTEIGEVARLMDLATALGVADRVMLFPPQPQERLADFYAAADVGARALAIGIVRLGRPRGAGVRHAGDRVARGRIAVRRRRRPHGLPGRGARSRGARGAAVAAAAATDVAAIAWERGRAPSPSLHVGRDGGRGCARVRRTARLSVRIAACHRVSNLSLFVASP